MQPQRRPGSVGAAVLDVGGGGRSAEAHGRQGSEQLGDPTRLEAWYGRPAATQGEGLPPHSHQGQIHLPFLDRKSVV